MFLKLIKRYFQAFFTGLLLLILFLNFKLYYSPDFSTSNGHNEGVLAQLNYLEQELHAGAAEDMQQLFPEGYVFTTVLYKLAWADFADPRPNGELKARALREIDWALAEINSPKGKAVFSTDLPLHLGVYYRGWQNYLLGKKLGLQAPENRDRIQVN